MRWHSDLGNYNTQQHWVAHSDGLFLVYTRRAANNDHVFRHRAPLFIARVDPDKLHVIRETEQILVTERGARLGNFGVVEVSPDETWVTVTEWMQPACIEKYGSDNSVFVAKLKWNRPNQTVSRANPWLERSDLRVLRAFLITTCRVTYRQISLPFTASASVHRTVRQPSAPSLVPGALSKSRAFGAFRR